MDTLGGTCRICRRNTTVVLDLGSTPAANWLLSSPQGHTQEFPLALEACVCGNFQLGFCIDAAELYRHYNYATPNSLLLERHYADILAHGQKRSYFGDSSSVLEIGSNVGLFLKFLQPYVKSVVGVDPAENAAEIANARGIPTVPQFFSQQFAREYRERNGVVDVVLARHCMAHNKDPYEVLDGIVEVLSDNGVFMLENAYAISTFENNEFDQIYHEHMFYYTLLAVRTMFERVGLVLCDVQFSSIHGGSFVCFAKKRAANPSVEDVVEAALDRERSLLRGGLVERFVTMTAKIQRELCAIVDGFAKQGKRIYAYGATAKGATLLNTSGITAATIPYCADSTPIKQGQYMPKAGVEIVSEEWAFANPPDVFLLTAWNYRDELIAKARGAGLLGTHFIVPVPSVEIV